MTEYLIRVHGRVQGVGFRDFTNRNARELGLHGTVRNLADGRVEIVAQGSSEALQALVGRLRDGPRAAGVDNLEINEHASKNTFRSFEVISNEY